MKKVMINKVAKKEMTARNARGLAGLLLAAFAAVALESFPRPSRASGEFLPPRAAFLLAQSGNTISFKNDCSSPLRLAVHFQNPSGQWQTKAWYSFSPGEKSRLNGVDTQNRYVYYYAEATDGSGVVWAGRDTSQDINGRNYGMRKFDIGPQFVNWTQRLTCSSAGSPGNDVSDPALAAQEREVGRAEAVLAPSFGLTASQLTEAQRCSATANLVLQQYDLLSLYQRRLRLSPSPRPVVGRDCARDTDVSQKQKSLIALYKRRLGR